MSKINIASHTAIFRNSDTEVLLTLRDDMPLWVLPGGHVENDETPEHAAIREVLEETGLNISISKAVVVYEANNGATQKYLYKGKVLSGTPTTSAETKDVRWFKLNELPFSMLLYERERIEETLQSPEQVIKKEYRINNARELRYFLKRPLLLLELLFKYFWSNLIPRK